MIKIFFEAPHTRTRFLQYENTAAFQLQDAFSAPTHREYHNRPIVPLNHIPGCYRRNQLSAPARPGRVVGATNFTDQAPIFGVPRGPKPKAGAATRTNVVNAHGIRYPNTITPSRGALFSSIRQTSDTHPDSNTDGVPGYQYYSNLGHNLPDPSNHDGITSGHVGKVNQQ